MMTHAAMILDDMDVLATLTNASRPSLSTLVDNCSAINLHASLHANLLIMQSVIWSLIDHE